MSEKGVWLANIATALGLAILVLVAMWFVAERNHRAIVALIEKMGETFNSSQSAVIRLNEAADRIAGMEQRLFASSERHLQAEKAVATLEDKVATLTDELNELKRRAGPRA